MNVIHDNSIDGVQDLQRELDSSIWEVGGSDAAAVRHLSFHLTIAAGKMARVEERRDHGSSDDEILDDVAADLLIYALQLANLRGHRLIDLYRERVASNLTGATPHRQF